MKKYCAITCLLFLYFNGYSAVYPKPQKYSLPDTPVCLRVMPAFSPNGDGKDDLWKIGNLDCIVAAEVKIYNRWGELVYESEQYKNDWNGEKKNKPLPQGVYMYIIKALLTDNTRSELKGSVSLLR